MTSSVAPSVGIIIAKHPKALKGMRYGRCTAKLVCNIDHFQRSVGVSRAYMTRCSAKRATTTDSLRSGFDTLNLRKAAYSIKRDLSKRTGNEGAIRKDKKEGRHEHKHSTPNAHCVVEIQ